MALYDAEEAQRGVKNVLIVMESQMFYSSFAPLSFKSEVSNL